MLRLLELLDEIAQDPVLSQRLALKGGTALHVFHLDLDRLSVDIDLNYIGALDVAAMERERQEVDAAIDCLFTSQGYRVCRRPTGHAGGKWIARYTARRHRVSETFSRQVLLPECKNCCNMSSGMPQSGLDTGDPP